MIESIYVLVGIGFCVSFYDDTSVPKDDTWDHIKIIAFSLVWPVALGATLYKNFLGDSFKNT